MNGPCSEIHLHERHQLAAHRVPQGARPAAPWEMPPWERATVSPRVRDAPSAEGPSLQPKMCLAEKMQVRAPRRARGALGGESLGLGSRPQQIPPTSAAKHQKMNSITLNLCCGSGRSRWPAGTMSMSQPMDRLSRAAGTKLCSHCLTPVALPLILSVIFLGNELGM